MHVHRASPAELRVCDSPRQDSRQLLTENIRTSTDYAWINGQPAPSVLTDTPDESRYHMTRHMYTHDTAVTVRTARPTGARVTPAHCPYLRPVGAPPPAPNKVYTYADVSKNARPSVPAAAAPPLPLRHSSQHTCTCTCICMCVCMYAGACSRAHGDSHARRPRPRDCISPSRLQRSRRDHFLTCARMLPAAAAAPRLASATPHSPSPSRPARRPPRPS